MYLVVIHHNFDDLPVKLFNNDGDARSYASTVDEVPEPILKTFKINRTDPVCVAVVSFDEQTGEPTRHETVRSFVKNPVKSADALCGEG